MSTTTSLQQWLQYGERPSSANNNNNNNNKKGQKRDNIFNNTFRPRWKGLVTKEGHIIKNWKERYFIIINDIMLYYNNKKEYEEQLSPVSYHIVVDVKVLIDDVDEVVVVETKDKKLFRLKSPERGNELFIIELKKAKEMALNPLCVGKYQRHSKLHLVSYVIVQDLVVVIDHLLVVVVEGNQFESIRIPSRSNINAQVSSLIVHFILS